MRGLLETKLAQLTTTESAFTAPPTFSYSLSSSLSRAHFVSSHYQDLDVLRNPVNAIHSSPLLLAQDVKGFTELFVVLLDKYRTHRQA